MNLQTSCKHDQQTGLRGGVNHNFIFEIDGSNASVSEKSSCKQPTENGCSPAVVANVDLTENDKSVTRERFYGWERASAKTLAAVFGVSVQRIVSIVKEN